MKKNKEFLYLVLAILCVWMPIFMGAWDKDKPASSTSLRSSNPEILANWDALETALSQDHTFASGSPDGKHTQITYTDPISTPGDVANEGVTYIKDVSAVVEFHWKDESGNELQMTSAGDLYSSTGLTVTTNATFNGGMTLGAGDDLIGSATSDITMNTNKFTVAGATGNTVVAGTLDVTGNIDPTTYETTNGGFLDEDAMGSDAADKVASQQSIKKYVDDNTTMVPAVSGAGTGYANEESVTFANGLILKQGTGSGAQGNTTITFGTAFPNACTRATITPVNAADVSHGFPVHIKSKSTTQLIYNQPNGGVAFDSMEWIAWGY